MLQQIATRVQRDCVNGEDKLASARAALQSVSTTLECFTTKPQNTPAFTSVYFLTQMLCLYFFYIDIVIELCNRKVH